MKAKYVQRRDRKTHTQGSKDKGNIRKSRNSRMSLQKHVLKNSSYQVAREGHQTQCSQKYIRCMHTKLLSCICNNGISSKGYIHKTNLPSHPLIHLLLKTNHNLGQGLILCYKIYLKTEYDKEA